MESYTKEKKARAALRRLFTNSYNEIERLINAEGELDIDEIQTHMQLLEIRYVNLDTKDAVIYEYLLDDEAVEEAELDDESKMCEGYSLKFHKMKIKVGKLKSLEEESLHNPSRRDDVAASSPLKLANVSTKYMLPKIKFTEFSGELKDWLPFWSQFKKIDRDPLLDPSDKLQYLVMATTPNSIARKVVESYPATEDMYPEVIKALKDRFGRDDLLIEFYIRELLKIMIKNVTSTSKLPLEMLYDQLRCHLRNLDSLGVATEQYASLILPLIASCLPQDLLIIWERTEKRFSITSNGKVETSKGALDNLLEFIRREVEGEQKVALAMARFNINDDCKTQFSGKKTVTDRNKIPTAAGLVSTITEANSKCIFCSNRHRSHDCIRAQSMSLKERRTIVDKMKACYCCLKLGHVAMKCRTKPKCIICKKSHFVLMCDARHESMHTKAYTSTNTTKENRISKEPDVETLACQINSCRVLMQTLKVTLEGVHLRRTARALIDTASQRSYILSSTAYEMGYESIRAETVRHSLFGGSSSVPTEHAIYQVTIASIDNQYKCRFEVMDQHKICGNVMSVGIGPWIDELSKGHIELSDVEEDGPIEILIGADVAGKLLTGKRKILKSGLVAIQTLLGWSLMGRLPEEIPSNGNNHAMLVTAMLTQQAKISDLWALDTLGITDPTERLLKEEIEAATQQHFLETVEVNDEGRFLVHLPWIACHPPLPSNYALAKKRLNALMKRLKTEECTSAYQTVLNDWERDGIIEEVPGTEGNASCHYLPHRHIIKPGSTTPLRPVFDASAREGRNPSLNQCLEKGPNLLEKIPTILARFRLKKIGLVGDIRRAFLQISVQENQRDYLRFLWNGEDGSIKIYRHCRVVFGLSPSPFLLEACINLHLKNIIDNCMAGELRYPIRSIEDLKNSFYVDNCVHSVENVEQAQEFIEIATRVMNERKFELRGWEFTGDGSINTTTNVLGLIWNRFTDSIEINLQSLRELDVHNVTKKVILSAAHRIFDPIGFSCGVTLIPKILLQQAGESDINWDQEVSNDIKKQFMSWLNDIDRLVEIKLPRWISYSDDTSTTLHIFSDASRSAYATVAFLRIGQESNVELRFLSAKARVSPNSKNNKKLTIPRLELLGASIAARLYTTIVKDFGWSEMKTIFWTDATTVLAWILREEPWDVFVHNRVKEIRSLTLQQSWRHIAGPMNPADLPSRGCSAKKLLESRWWEGPDWLKTSPDLWPHSPTEYNEEEINCEKKKSIVSCLTCDPHNPNWYYRYFSSFKKIVRLIGWISRFKHNCTIQHRYERLTGNLSAGEFAEAEKRVILLVQRESFSGYADPKLRSLPTLIDRDGIIRIKTKIVARKDIREFCFPAVLPSTEHLVVLRLVLDLHKDNCHVGSQMILTLVRERFWVLKGRRSIRSALNKCVRCKRYKAKRKEVVPTPLPEDRVRNAKVFEVVGIDLAGPLYLKSKGAFVKAWVALFTCGVYRAVHLELLNSLSTDSFLLGFRRFISRRGRPTTVYSDHGTNFIGANHAVQKLNWDRIAQYSSIRKIDWKFNPPASPWWGGWWERLIGVLKTLLRRVLGNCSISYEEMQTILCDCEAIINSRPITYVSEDPNDLTPLTPGMFLQDLSDVGVPDFDLVEAKDLNKRLKYRQQLKKTLLQRFRSEYLGQLGLQAKKGYPRELKVGEIVLIGSDDKRRSDWPLARIVEVMRGKDGHVRVVKARTATGDLIRAAQRIYPLELELAVDVEGGQIGKRLRQRASTVDEKEEEEKHLQEDDNVKNSVVTRSGRRVKIPKRFNL